MTSRDERGLTLVEVLVSLVVGGLLIGVMTQVMFVGLRDLDETNSRVAGSNDTQLIAAYFTSDVASADTISTTGTKSHAAPSVSPTVTNTMLVSFWSLRSVTGLAMPDGMAAGWNTTSTRFRIAMADEPTPAAGITGNRVASSTDGASSLTHSVALARSATITRRPGWNAAMTVPAGATSLAVTKPTTAANDTLLAHVAVAGGTNTSVTAPAGWTLVSNRNAGTALKSAIYQKLATGSEPATYTFAFANAAGSSVAREAAIGVVAYSGVATTGGVNQNATEINPCGGEVPVLLLSWTDRHSDPAEDMSYQVAYNLATVDSETRLIRQRCTAAATFDMSGAPNLTQTLASNLAPASAVATCASTSTAFATTTTVTPTASAYCAFLPVTVTLSLAEPSGREDMGRIYTVRASTRTDRDDP